jgi:hypothetical protein
VVTATRIATLHLFDTGLYHNIYVKLKPVLPLAAGAGIYITKKTIDIVADLLREKFRPRRDGVTHTIYLFGPYAAFEGCGASRILHRVPTARARQ